MSENPELKHALEVISAWAEKTSKITDLPYNPSPERPPVEPSSPPAERREPLEYVPSLTYRCACGRAWNTEAVQGTCTACGTGVVFPDTCVMSSDTMLAGIAGSSTRERIPLGVRVDTPSLAVREAYERAARLVLTQLGDRVLAADIRALAPGAGA